jgi:hypothetical protein
MSNQGRYGAGIVLNYSGAVIRNNIIAGNSGGEDYGGGGIWILGNSADHPRIIENNTIVNNHADQWGGGLRLIYTTVQVTNCIFWGNTASSSPQIQGGAVVLSYSTVEGGFAGTNILEEDPMFTGDLFMLDNSSPCIDAGNPDSQYNDPEDPQQPGMAMYPAQGTVTSDMGAFGGPGAGVFPELATAVKELFGKPGDLSLGLFPNPVSLEQGFVAIKNPTYETVSISVNNMHGERMEGFRHSLAGGETLTLNLQGFDAGMYIVTATSDSGKTFVNKLVIH